MKISYNWLSSYLPEIPASEKLHDIFTYHLCEVESVEHRSTDTIFDVNILPNRAHDLLSHQGIARELSGQLGILFKDPTERYKIPPTHPTRLTIDARLNTCRRYMGRIVKNVTVGPSPAWIVEYLTSIGQRSINNIVDATNIVLYDCGQPCHAFDRRVFQNDNVIISNAKNDETLELLGSDRIVATLKASDLIITNSAGDTLALAGVKGGTHSGVSESTTEIVLEVANFDPVSIRKTARRIGVLSDAAKRFENDLSPTLAPYAMRALSALILELCPNAIFEDVVDVYPTPQKEKRLTFTARFVNQKLGALISADQIETILKQYTYSYERAGDSFTIFVPSLRLDLTIPEDMVEEIGRIVGYDHIVPKLPTVTSTPQENEVYRQIEYARAILRDTGYSEVMTYAFAKKGDFEVARGASGKSALRTALSTGLKDSYELNKQNMQLLGLDEIKLFEIGTVFTKDGESIHVATIDAHGVTEVALADFRGSMTAKSEPERGEVLPKIEKKFTPWSQYPFIVRDIALWVPQSTDVQIVAQEIVREKSSLLIREPRLIDRFSKDGLVSYAFRLIFQSFDKTLTDEEVNSEMEAITKRLSAHTDWNIR